MTDTLPSPHDLQDRLAHGPAHLGIIGMGYVGLPLMLAAIRAGLQVTGFDIDRPKVANLNRGRSPLQHVGDAAVEAARATGRFAASADFTGLAACDAILICVPTPLGPHREPDLSYIERTTHTIAAALRPGQLVVLESTTWPGTTEEVVKPILERSGLAVGRDVWLAYSPEREDPGNAEWATSNIPKVVGGTDEASLALACALYRRLVARVVPVTSARTAEAVKLTENIFRSVNIALVNEPKLTLTAMGIDVFEVIGAAATKPFGYMPFWPGPGLGGHCIPIDPFYLTWKARAVGEPTRFVELAGEINHAMPAWVVGRLAEAIDRHSGKGLSRARILLVGIAYKKNVDDVRESPGLALAELLLARGCELLFHDPHVAAVPPTRRHGALEGRRSTPLDADMLRRQDAVLVVTDHDAVDWPLIAAEAPLVVDTRDTLRRRGLSTARLVLA